MPTVKLTTDMWRRREKNSEVESGWTETVYRRGDEVDVTDREAKLLAEYGAIEVNEEKSSATQTTTASASTTSSTSKSSTDNKK